MANGSTIKIRRSSVGGKVPTTSDLALGELALNTYDGKIFLKTVQISGQTTTEEIITLEKQLTAGTGVTINNGAINIGQNVSTSISPTFAGATFNGVTNVNGIATIAQTGPGTENSLRVAGYVGSAGSVFAVGVSDIPSDGVVLKGLNSTLTDNAKLTLSGSQIVLKTTNKQWSFSDSGNIQLPAGGDIINSKNESILKFPTVKKITFDNPLAYSYGSLNFTNVSATNSSNNYITVDDSSIFAVNSPVIFYSLVSFGGIRKSLQYPDITTYFVKSIPNSTTITITESTDIETGTPGPVFAVSDSTGKMIVSTNIMPIVKYVVGFNGSNNRITLDSSSGLNIGDPVMLSCSPEFNDIGVPTTVYGNIEMNGVYYIRSIPDGESITVTDQLGNNTDVVLSTKTNIPSIVLTLLSPNSYQLQRAPRLFTPFDTIETTGYDLSSMTYGDLYYREARLYVMVDLGYGTPQPMDLTPTS